MHYSSHGAYSQSKLALVLFTYYLQEQLMASGSSVTVNAVDPGMVDTALYDNLWSLAQAMKKPVAKILFRVRLHLFSYSFLSHRVLCDRSVYTAAAGWLRRAFTELQQDVQYSFIRECCRVY